MHAVGVGGALRLSSRDGVFAMRALMNLAIEPALRVFEVSAMVVIDPSQRAVKRVLKVMADTPIGAVQIVRDRYPRSRAHEVLSCMALPAYAA